MGSPAIDYDALASQHGGAVNYDALASQHGGQPAGADHSFDFGKTLSQYADRMNPVTAVQGAAQMAAHPIEAGKSYSEQTQALAKKAEESFKAGHYGEAVRHSLGYLLNGIPGVGALLDEAGNKAQSGDAEGAIADTAALATQLVGPKYLPKAASAAADAVKAIPEVIAKTPKTAAGIVGGALGGAVGHYVPIPGAGLAGAYLGKTAAESALEDLRSSLVKPKTAASRPAVPFVQPAPAPQPAASAIALPTEAPAIPRPDWRQQIVQELNQPAPAPPTPAMATPPAAAPAPPPPPAPAAPAPPAAAPQGSSAIAQALAKEMGYTPPEPTAPIDYAKAPRAAKAKALASFLHSDGNGIPHADAARMNPQQWKLAAQGAGVPEPSPSTMKQALQELLKLENPNRN